LSVYKYNLKKDLTDHSNPQRPGYAIGNEGGLLLCSWPRGGKLSLPFVYSDEVWTGIEYQVASHLIFQGRIAEGLDIVRTAGVDMTAAYAILLMNMNAATGMREPCPAMRCWKH